MRSRSSHTLANDAPTVQQKGNRYAKALAKGPLQPKLIGAVALALVSLIIIAATMLHFHPISTPQNKKSEKAGKNDSPQPRGKAVDRSHHKAIADDLDDLLGIVAGSPPKRKANKAIVPPNEIPVVTEQPGSEEELATASVGGQIIERFVAPRKALDDAPELSAAMRNFLFGEVPVGGQHPLGSSPIAPRIRSKNVFTAPLPLYEVMSQSGFSSEDAEVHMRMSLTSKVENDHRIFTSNPIMQLYKGIPPSYEDAGIANPSSSSDDSAEGQSSFFALMDSGMYSLHPMRVGIEDYYFTAAKRDGKEAADGSMPLRGGQLGYWSARRPFLKELLQRYESFHHEGMRRLRARLGRGHEHKEDTAEFTHFGGLAEADFQQFVVVKPVGQLCNRLVAITSAFIFSLLTRRILLIDDADFYCSSDDLFLEPGLEWILRDAGAAVRPWGGQKGQNKPAHEDGGGPSLLPSYLRQGHILSDYSKVSYGRKLPPPPPLGTFATNPLAAISDAYGSDVRMFNIQNPESGIWPETEPFLCSSDYRKSYKATSSKPSVVSFTVNQYLVPYFYRNQHYHSPMLEIFGTAGEPSAGDRGTDAKYIWASLDDIFSPIAHFLFRPIPSLLKMRDDYIREQFIDTDGTNGIVASYVVGLQVRSGGDFTDHFMSEADWHLYRDCGVQTSPPDVALPQYESVDGDHQTSPSVITSTLGSRSGKLGRRFKFFVATDTEKGRQAARQYLRAFPSANVRIGDSMLKAKLLSDETSGADIPVLFGPGNFKLSNNPDGVRAALLDLLILAACDDRVQTAWSSFGYFASGISGVNGNIVVNRAPFVDGNEGSTTNCDEEKSECWAGIPPSKLSVLHPKTLARHTVRKITENKDKKLLIVSYGVINDKHGVSSPPRAKSSLQTDNYRVIMDHARSHNGNSVVLKVRPPSGAGEWNTSLGLAKSNDANIGSNDRTSEQRFMGNMHKSDKRVQCVRVPTKEPCFHKFESWGASETSCYDWAAMTFPEMIRAGRYC